MTFEATVMTLILLLGLWLLYRQITAQIRVAAQQDSNNGSSAHTHINSAQPADKGPTWIERVPKVFTQPHIVPDSIAGNIEYHQTDSANAYTQEKPAVAATNVGSGPDTASSADSAGIVGADPVEQISSPQEPLQPKQPPQTQSQHGIHKLPTEVKESGNADTLLYLDEVSITQDLSADAEDQASEAHSGKVKQMFVRPDEQDDLKLIKGIGAVMEKTLHELGITTFKQLASFQPSDVQRVSDALTEFPGRIERDNWVGQAREINSTSPKQ